MLTSLSVFMYFVTELWPIILKRWSGQPEKQKNVCIAQGKLSYHFCTNKKNPRNTMLAYGKNWLKKVIR